MLINTDHTDSPSFWNTCTPRVLMATLIALHLAFAGKRALPDIFVLETSVQSQIIRSFWYLSAFQNSNFSLKKTAKFDHFQVLQGTSFASLQILPARIDKSWFINEIHVKLSFGLQGALQDSPLLCYTHHNSPLSRAMF